MQVDAAALEQVVFQIIQAQMIPALGIDSDKDKLELQTIRQEEHEKKLRTLQDSKRQLYEKYVFGEIDLETYKAEKAKYDAELIREKNIHNTIVMQTKLAQETYEAQRNRWQIKAEIEKVSGLTQSLADMLIQKVFVFPGNRIEIQYVTQDLFQNGRIMKKAEME